MTDDARSAVLERLRAARAARDGSDQAAEAAVEARLARPPSNLIPARAEKGREDRLEVFRLQAEAVQTTVGRIASLGELPEHVAGFLRRHNLPLELVAADDPALAGADFKSAMIEATRGRAAREDDLVGLTVASAGIAETGTVLLRSSAATPTTLAFLPDTVVIVLDSDRVMRSYEEALRALLSESEGLLPRSVNLVTGPSRTADIEQTLQLGAHGPRRLHVVLVDGPPPPAA